MSNKLLYITLALIGGMALWRWQNMDGLFMGACALVIVTHWQHINMVGLAGLLLAYKVLEWGVYGQFGQYLNPYFHYVSYMMFDVIIIVLLCIRAPLMRGIHYGMTGHREMDRYHMNQADTYLIWCYLIDLLVNTLALLERVLRNLNDIGFPADAAYVVWLHEHARVIYTLFPYLKLGIFVAEIMAILSIPYFYREEAHVLEG